MGRSLTFVRVIRSVVTHARTRGFAPRFVVPFCLWALLLLAQGTANGFDRSPDPFDELNELFTQQTLPLLKQFCLDCHSTEKKEGELDLQRFVTLSEIRRHPSSWQKVAAMISQGEMPPKESPQPSAVQRQALVDWVDRYLKAEAFANAGDPGRVVFWRLSNAEYTNTVRDLTGLAALDPAKEFPIDSASGEGFTNTGQSLVMSPTMLSKYLDAAKEIAEHAVLLPDGFRFSASTTRSDWTKEYLDRIRAFYSRYTDAGGGEQVNLQGVIFQTNAGGRIPIDRYLTATIVERASLISGQKTIEEVASERGLSPKYLGLLWKRLNDPAASLVLNGLQSRWKMATATDLPILTNYIAEWQTHLFRFSKVGQIGKKDGPVRWVEPVNSIQQIQEIRFKLPDSKDGQPIAFTLSAGDAGDGATQDRIVWKQPRLVASGRPDLPLKDVRQITRTLMAARRQMLLDTEKYLAAAEEAAEARGGFDVKSLAARHGVEAVGLKSWLDFLGIGSGSVVISGRITEKFLQSSGYDFIQGWSGRDALSVVANSSDQEVRIPGLMRPHSVAVHPSPSLKVAVGWMSPFAGQFRIEGFVLPAHSECSNGVTWSLELRRGAVRKRLAAGLATGRVEHKFGPLDRVEVQQGDLLSLLVGSRDGNHNCDLTEVEIKITNTENPQQTWSLAGDLSGSLARDNPHQDRFGHVDVWHFYAELDTPNQIIPSIPRDSTLARWSDATDPQAKHQLARDFQLLMQAGGSHVGSPDDQVVKQLTSLGGPLLAPLFNDADVSVASTRFNETQSNEDWGIDPKLFEISQSGQPINPADLSMEARSSLTVRLPADLAQGCEFVATVSLAEGSRDEASVQIAVSASQTSMPSGLLADAPILTSGAGSAHQRMQSAMQEFRDLFPAALCYPKIVPVDEVITMLVFYREDDHLIRLMLDDAEHAKLDQLWSGLMYVSQEPLVRVDVLTQLIEFATQDSDPVPFRAVLPAAREHAAQFREFLIATEPLQIDELMKFAALAYRRPLADSEVRDLRSLYASLRRNELSHEEALRKTLARVLVAPAFLYHVEQPAIGTQSAPISDSELASRLSYFLWSTMPDAELRQLAESKKLHQPEHVAAQLRRMLKDEKARRLATEFCCQWLHIYEFDRLDEKSERHFPTFLSLRGAMYEESIRFCTDLFQNNGSVLSLLDADHTFLNQELAEHYGIPGVSGPEWRRIDGLRPYDRGGILGQSTTLAKQSGASRTSPILRGNWISEVLLGERLPRPPKDVPQLPTDETATQGLSVRQLVEQHTSNAKCSVCHQRIDPMGFSLEAFDAIGRRRDKDLGDRPVDTKARAMDGHEFEGLAGLRDYLLTVRREAFVRQFCRKLLGFALGRTIQLSDEPLLTEIQTRFKQDDYRVLSALELIVTSRQFQEIRGRDVEDLESVEAGGVD